MAHLVALVTMLGGALSTLGLVLALNRISQPPEQDASAKAVSFEVQAPPPKPPKKRKAETERKRKATQPRQSLLPPPPSLAAALSGVDLGIDTYQLDSLGDVSDQLLGDVDQVVHTEDTVDSRPTPQVTSEIPVPAEARSRNLSGRVVLSLLIGADGSVRKARVLEAAPKGIFEEAALRAVSTWTFQPATYRGRNVEVWVTLPIEFQP